MTLETTRAVAERLVALCKAHREDVALAELYRADAVSVEASPIPGTDGAATEGLEGIRGKHAWWAESFEVHSAEVEGPYLHGDDRLGVIFETDATMTATGERMAMKELGIYDVDAEGRIAREAFFSIRLG